MLPLMFHTNDSPSGIHTLEGLTDYLSSTVTRPTMLDDTDYGALTATERAVHDRERSVYNSGGIVINTPALLATRQSLAQCFAFNVGRNSGHAGLILNGQPTIGKTEAAKALMRIVYTQYKRQFPDFESHNRIPIVYIALGAACNAKSLMKDFAEFLGMPVRDRESMGDIRNRVIAALIAAGTQLIVVDEIQNLAGRTAGLGEAVDVLKNLHNRLPATFVYAGVNLISADNALLGGDRGQQLSGRFTIYDLESLNLSNPADRTTWRKLIAAFEKELPLRHQTPGELIKHSDYMYERTSGSVGSLAKLLTLSAAELINDPSQTHEVITEKLMSRQTLDKIAEDGYVDKKALRSGKEPVRAKNAESNYALSALVGS